jgi:hypothetical protein
MSTLLFELKDEHIALLKNLGWSLNKENIIVGVANDGDELAPPFGENNIYEAMDLILNGRPDDFDPFKVEEFTEYSQEQKDVWDKLYSDLTTALEIILKTGKFETGIYKSRFHLRDWRKIKP